MKGTYQSDNDFLLSAVQRGDQKAFDTLFRRYYPMLCAYGHRFVELEDAEEIVEDSLFSLSRSVASSARFNRFSIFSLDIKIPRKRTPYLLEMQLGGIL